VDGTDSETMTITPEQCRAARVLAKIGRDAVAAAAGVRPDDVKAFETGIAPASDGLARALRQALEDHGVDFLPEENGRGVGVRLRFDRAGTRQISRWESEGGAAADDDVP